MIWQWRNESDYLKVEVFYKMFITNHPSARPSIHLHGTTDLCGPGPPILRVSEPYTVCRHAAGLLGMGDKAKFEIY